MKKNLYVSMFALVAFFLMMSGNAFAETEANKDEIPSDERIKLVEADPFPASPYEDPDKKSWLIEEEETSPRSFQRKSSNWLKGSFKDMEKKIVNRYNNTTAECRYENPAYECSGLLMRGLYKPGGEYYVPWSVSPKAKKRGNVLSFTYLRKDLGFSRFPLSYTAGFIAYPMMQTPSPPDVPVKQKPLKPLCYFPIDGYTDYRDEYGCGQTKQVVLKDNQNVVNTDYSKRCHEIGVTSFHRWKNHYHKSHEKLYYQEQCGFDLRISNAKYASRNTQIGMKTTNYIQKQTNGFKHAEIITSGWPAEDEGLDVRKIPFMAFFFLDNTNSDSLQGARRMQKDFYTRTGIRVPVVKVKLPESHRQRAWFTITRELQSPDVPMNDIKD